LIGYFISCFKLWIKLYITRIKFDQILRIIFTKYKHILSCRKTILTWRWRKQYLLGRNFLVLEKYSYKKPWKKNRPIRSIQMLNILVDAQKVSINWITVSRWLR
jgi:hypothetical protein